MHAVGPRPPRDARVAGDQRRGARGLDDRHRRFRHGLERPLVEVVLRQDDGGDVAAPQGIAEHPRQTIGIGHPRRDEDQSASRFDICHGRSFKTFPVSQPPILGRRLAFPREFR